MLNLQDKRVQVWNAVAGEESFRFNYNLTSDSIVFDVGGYLGETTKIFRDKYNATVYCFEPVTIFYNQIVEKFKNDSKVKVFNFGLGSSNYKTTINLDADATGELHKLEAESTEIEIKDIVEFLQQENISLVDLADVNIEGGEYGLLERLLSSGLITKFTNFQVQFHFLNTESVNLVESLRTQLFKTHKPTYMFDFVWENWTTQPTYNNVLVSQFNALNRFLVTNLNKHQEAVQELDNLTAKFDQLSGVQVKNPSLTKFYIYKATCCNQAIYS